MLCPIYTDTGKERIAELSTVRSVMYAGIPAGGTTYNIAVQDVNANVLGSTSIVTSATPTTIAPFDITWEILLCSTGRQ